MSQTRTGVLVLLLLGMGSILISCSVSKNTSSPSANESSPDDSPRILFLNYEITRDSVNSTLSAHLINTVLAKGSLKNDRTPPIQPVTGDLELQVLDKDQHILTTLYISNPLDKSVEFVNDTGELQQKMISLETVQFSVRLQADPGASSTILKRITGPNSESTVLLKTSIL
jgi:hypothetical protein